MCLTGSTSGKEHACQCRRQEREVSSVLGLGRSPGVGNGNSLHYFCLENPMGRRTWWATMESQRVGHD